MNSQEDSSKTHFVPTGRDRSEPLEKKVIRVRRASRVPQALDAMVDAVLILNEQRQVVTARCSAAPPGNVAASVHNAVVMPKGIQMQVFQRSFSTRAASGRGIGTHSMKLFGECYLGGKVEFTSRKPEGITFTLTLPGVMA